MGVCPCKGEGTKARWLAKVSGSLDNWGTAMADELIEAPEPIDEPTNNDHDETAVGLNIEKKVRFDSKIETSISGDQRVGVLPVGYCSRNLSLLTAKPPDTLSAVGTPEWQEIEITVDSGACDTVMSTSMSPHISLLQNELSKD